MTVVVMVFSPSTPISAGRFAAAVRCCQVQINPPPPEGPVAPAGKLTLVSCDALDERVLVLNKTTAAISLTGYLLHDRDSNFETPLDQWGALRPGMSIGILSGLNPVSGPGEVIWLERNVWNNDGDEATLIAPDGTASIVNC